MTVTVILAVVVGVIGGMVAGSCWEASRKGGTLDCIAHLARYREKLKSEHERFQLLAAVVQDCVDHCPTDLAQVARDNQILADIEAREWGQS